ncbi:glycosyltransferase family 4 protein [Roseimaritima sediminicola]|uniref:glycosyltransferase family 4 protein n=1 Tax=Roseimaritima sediminicola TaxID=2662066 RepID=UPI0013868C20|nr:glycosyltransferase [Roseimaritima sediminicola]
MIAGIVTISETLRNAFLSYCPDFPQEKLIVAHDAASEPFNKEQLDIGKRKNRLHVGYVGSFKPGKGIEHIIKVAAITTNSRIAFHVVGGSPGDIRSLRLALPNNITFYGQVPHKDVFKYVNAFDVCLLPNQFSMRTGRQSRDIGQFTSPLKLFEYMAAGKPIIASQLPSIQEVVNNETALLVEPDDPEEWKSALITLRDNKEFRTALGRRAKTEHRAKFTWDARATRLSTWLQGDVSRQH